MKIYIVQKGDKASEIAAKHGVSLSALKNLNTQLSDPDKLKPGMKIKVPTESKPVLRKPKVVKKETMEEVRLTNDPVDETSSEEPSTLQTFSGNTYTYKIPQDSNTIYPFNEGEEGAFPNLEGTVPMMEDPYPNAIKEKEKPAPVPYYGNPNQGPYPNANPYTNPYYYPPQTPTYYGQPGFPAPKGGSTGGYGYSPGMPTGNSPQNYGYYGHTPSSYIPGMRPNPLGCRAEGPYPDYYPEAAYGGATNQENDGLSGQEMTSTYMPNQVETQGMYYHPQPQGWQGEQGGYQAPQPQGWQGEPQETYQAPQPQGWQGEQGAYQAPQPQGWQGEQGAYQAPQPQGWQGEPQGTYQAPQPQGWQGGPQEPNPYPYVYPQHSNQGSEGQGPVSSPYSVPAQSWGQGAYGAGTVSPSAPQMPDYSLWETYVDYHQPPYQPDFPIKTQKD